MPLYMDYHDNLKLPAEAIQQIAQETRDGTADQFGVRRSSSTTTPTARSTACPKAPTSKR